MGLWGRYLIVVRYGGVRSKFRCPESGACLHSPWHWLVAEATTPQLPHQRQATIRSRSRGFFGFSPHNRQNRSRRGRRGFRSGRWGSATRQAPGQRCWGRGDEDVIQAAAETQPWAYVCIVHHSAAYRRWKRPWGQGTGIGGALSLGFVGIGRFTPPKGEEIQCHYRAGDLGRVQLGGSSSNARQTKVI